MVNLEPEWAVQAIAFHEHRQVKLAEIDLQECLRRFDQEPVVSDPILGLSILLELLLQKRAIGLCGEVILPAANVPGVVTPNLNGDRRHRVPRREVIQQSESLRVLPLFRRDRIE